MRIAFDLDGTLADLGAVLAEAAVRMFGPVRPRPARAEQSPATDAGSAEPSVADEGGDEPALQAVDPTPADEPVPPLVHRLTPGQQSRLWRHVLDRENFWETLNETEQGIVGRLAVLALERRWDVIFLTQRPPSAGNTCQIQSQRWLARLGFAFPSVFLVPGSRGKVASALDLDVVVDDRPDNCLDVVLESRARAFLVWRGDASETPAVTAKRLNIEVVGSVGDCLSILAAEREEKAEGVLGRLRRLMGSG